jgi:hypothetical protein
MPAGLPGSTPVQNAANPSLGAAVIFDLMSGPKGAPKENDKDYATGTGVANANASTGGLSTGIGFGQTVILDPLYAGTAKNFTDDYTPGVTKPDGTASADSTYMYIGGGKSTANVGGSAPTVPYTVGFGIGGAGNGGSRDAGAGPAFTGFPIKLVTAAAGVAVDAAVEANWTNRSGKALLTGQSTFGSGTAASVAPAMMKPLDEPEPAEKVKSEVKPDLKPEVKPDLKPVFKPDVKPDLKK